MHCMNLAQGLGHGSQGSGQAQICSRSQTHSSLVICALIALVTRQMAGVRTLALALCETALACLRPRQISTGFQSHNLALTALCSLSVFQVPLPRHTSQGQGQPRVFAARTACLRTSVMCQTHMTQSYAWSIVLAVPGHCSGCKMSHIRLHRSLPCLCCCCYPVVRFPNHTPGQCASAIGPVGQQNPSLHTHQDREPSLALRQFRLHLHPDLSQRNTVGCDEARHARWFVARILDRVITCTAGHGLTLVQHRESCAQIAQLCRNQMQGRLSSESRPARQAETREPRGVARLVARWRRCS